MESPSRLRSAPTNREVQPLEQAVEVERPARRQLLDLPLGELSTDDPDLAGDSTRAQGLTTVVLLEGPSDVAAVRVVAAAYGLTDSVHRYYLVGMGGVTNIRRHLLAFRAAPVPVRVIGMCDAGEAQFFVRALQANGARIHTGTDLADYGFYVCDADLEDELIRALGPERVRSVLCRLGLQGRLATFRRQPAWRDRPLHEQLHRFAGTTSGRKTVLAGALAEDLAPSEVPAPLRRLVAAMARSPVPARP